MTSAHIRRHLGQHWRHASATRRRRSRIARNRARFYRTLVGLQLTKQSMLVLDANQNVTLSGDLIAGTMTITAETGSITMPSGGQLSATALTLTAGGTIGALGTVLHTNVSQLTTDTSAN